MSANSPTPSPPDTSTPGWDAPRPPRWIYIVRVKRVGSRERDPKLRTRRSSAERLLKKALRRTRNNPWSTEELRPIEYAFAERIRTVGEWERVPGMLSVGDPPR